MALSIGTWLGFILLLFPLLVSASEVKFNYKPGTNNLNTLKVEDLQRVLNELEAVEDFNCSSKGCYVKLKPLLVDYELKGFSLFSKYQLEKILGLKNYYRYSQNKLIQSGNIVRFYLANLGYLDAAVKTKIFIDKRGYTHLTIIGREGSLYLWGGFKFENGCFSAKEFYKEFNKPLGIPFNYFLLYEALDLSRKICKSRGYLWVFPYYKEPFSVKRKTITSFLWRNLKIKFPLFIQFIGEYLEFLVKNPIEGIKFLLHPTFAVVPTLVLFKKQKLSINFIGNKALNKEKLKEEILNNLTNLLELKESILEKTIKDIYQEKGFYLAKVSVKRVGKNSFKVFINEGPRFRVKFLVEPPIVEIKNSCEYFSQECVSQADKQLKEKLIKETYLFKKITVSKKVDRKRKTVFVIFKVINPRKVNLEVSTTLDITYKPLKENLKEILEEVDWKACLYREGCLSSLREKFLRFLDRWQCISPQVEITKRLTSNKVIIKVRLSCKSFEIFGDTVYWIEGSLPKREANYMVLNFKGKKFNPKLIEVLNERLNRSQLLDSFMIKTIKGNSKKVVILVEGKQRNLLSVEGSLGYSSDEGALFEGTLKVFDLLRSGEILSLRLKASQKRTLYNLGYFDPFFFSKHYFTAGNLFRKYEEHKSYDVTFKGFSIVVGRYLGFYSSISLSYLFQRYSLEYVGNFINSYLAKVVLSFQTRYPIYVGINKKGLLTGIFSFHSSVRGDKFTKLTGEVNYSSLLFKELFLHTKLAAGWVSENAPIFEKFFLGGIKNLKGYAYESVAPPGGGNYFWFSTLELGIKLPIDGIYIFGGTDFGTSTKTKKELFKNIKKDIFVGAGALTELGPIRFVVATPTEKGFKLSTLKYLLLIGFNF